MKKKVWYHPLELTIPEVGKTFLKMKLTLCVIMLTFLGALGNNSFSQSTKLSLELEDATVREVLEAVENKTDFFFLYSEKLIDVDRKVTLNMNETSVEKILDRLFKNSAVDYKVKGRQIILTSLDADAMQVLAQQKITIKGTVTDDAGAPLPGVAVVEKGTTNGTITDFDGNYTLGGIPANGTLVFSFVGMRTEEIAVEGQNNINLRMEEESIGLEEVVAIGYGTQKKADLTGAVSAVKGENLAKASTPNLSAALTGKVTGVIATQASGQPGYDGTTFRIRGNSTTKNNSPLIIVDGVVRSFSRIDPYEIESVTVLKDAASTAVYGARAANGVLLITTKRGAKGKPSFNYSGSYGIQSQTRKIELMNAAEYTKYINEAKANFGEQLLFTEEEVAKYQSGQLPSYDWLASVLSNSAPMQKHNLSVTGGNDRSKYFLSFGYLDQEGFYATSGYKQYNIRSNVDVKLSDRLDFGADISGRIEDRVLSAASALEDGKITENSEKLIYQGALFGRPYLNPLLDEEVGPGALGYNGMTGSPKGFAERSGTNQDVNYVFQSSFNLKYKVPGIDGLLAKAFYSFDFTTGTNKIFQFPYTYYQLNEVDGTYFEAQGGPSSTTNLRQTRDLRKQNTLQLSLNYSKTIKDHTISALALFEQIESNYSYITAFRDEFISTALPELFAGGTDLWSNNGSSSETARRGYIGRIDYDYKGKYLFQANMRVDQSFNFPDEGRNGYFPAFSAGWRISEEEFMQGVGFISNLKLRGSWGKVGNDRVPAFQYLSNFKFSGGSVIGGSYQKGIVDTGIANPLITWEKATTTDIGFDLGLFDNKLAIEFDYFKKRTEDILEKNSGVVPGTFGADLPDENIGIVDSWGTEGVIRYTNNFNGLNVMAEANISWYDNELVYMAEPESTLPSIAKTGRSLNLRYGYLSDGLFQTQDEIDNAAQQFSSSIHNSLKPGDIRYKDINGRDEEGNLTGKPDGKINSDDRAVIGSSGDPNIVFGFNLNLEYKGFDLAANFQGATDFSRFIRPIPFARDGNTYREMIDSWRPGNEDAKYPRLSSGDLPANSTYASDFWVTEVSYLRLRNLELGYNLVPLKEVLNRAGIDNIRIFLAGTNLLTISNLDWRDPEGASGSNPFYPQVKTVSFGVNVKF